MIETRHIDFFKPIYRDKKTKEVERVERVHMYSEYGLMQLDEDCKTTAKIAARAARFAKESKFTLELIHNSDHNIGVFATFTLFYFREFQINPSHHQRVN